MTSRRDFLKLGLSLISSGTCSGLISDNAEARPKKRQRKTIGEQVIEEAEKYLGVRYNMGGRLGQKNSRLRPGLDCQGIIIIPYGKICHFNWRRVPVHNNMEIVQSGYLGHPVTDLDGVLEEKLDHSKLKTGDVLYFLDSDYPNDDTPLLVQGDKKYLTWHTGLYKGGDEQLALHASPSADKVILEPLKEIYFEALYVTRRER